MSAYVVNTEHIDALITAGLHYAHPYGPIRWNFTNPGRPDELQPETATATGAMLLAENVRSVDYRYQENGATPAYTFRRLQGHPAPVVVLKLIDAYEYQACETPDWKDTAAASFCDALRRRMIAALPGYNDAPWGAYDRDVFAAPVPAGR